MRETARLVVEFALRRNKILQGSSLTTFRKENDKFRAAPSLMVRRSRVKKHQRRTSVDSARRRNGAFQGSSLLLLKVTASSHVVQRLKNQLRRKKQPLRRHRQNFPTPADNVQTKRLELAGFSGQHKAW